MDAAVPARHAIFPHLAAAGGQVLLGEAAATRQSIDLGDVATSNAHYPGDRWPPPPPASGTGNEPPPRALPGDSALRRAAPVLEPHVLAAMR